MNSFEFNLGKVGKLAKDGMPLRKAWQRAYKKGSVSQTPPASKIRKMLKNAAQESADGSVGRRILDNRRPPVSQPIRGTLGLSRGTFYKTPGVVDILFDEKIDDLRNAGRVTAAVSGAGLGLSLYNLRKGRGKRILPKRPTRRPRRPKIPRDPGGIRKPGPRPWPSVRPRRPSAVLK